MSKSSPPDTHSLLLTMFECVFASLGLLEPSQPHRDGQRLVKEDYDQLHLTEIQEPRISNPAE